MKKETVLLVGDLHGDSGALHLAFSKAEGSGASAIVQLGDYGFGWRFLNDECWFSAIASDLSQATGIPLYWIDGNHENFDALYQLPLDENGYRPIAEGVVHLPRGATLAIGESRIRAFGGAHSVDRAHRVKGVSWWPQETCTDDDVQRALEAGPADIFVSHDAPSGVQDNAGLRRKLEHWGPMHAELSIANQEKVRAALDASGASQAFHGHLHHSYSCDLGSVLVRGLDRDGTRGNTLLIEV